MNTMVLPIKFILAIFVKDYQVVIIVTLFQFLWFMDFFFLGITDLEKSRQHITVLSYEESVKPW